MRLLLDFLFHRVRDLVVDLTAIPQVFFDLRRVGQTVLLAIVILIFIVGINPVPIGVYLGCIFFSQISLIVLLLSFSFL